MEIGLLALLGLVHLIFLYKILIEAGFLWAVGCFFLPILCLVVAYLHWPDLKGIFLVELALVVAVALTS